MVSVWDCSRRKQISPPMLKPLKLGMCVLGAEGWSDHDAWTERNVMKPDSTGLAPSAALSFSPRLAGEWPHLQPEVTLTLEM